MPKISELTIEIQNNAKGATTSLNNLSAALKKFQEAKNDLNFGDVDTSGIERMRDYISQLNQVLQPLAYTCNTIRSAFTMMGMKSVASLQASRQKVQELATTTAGVASAAGQAVPSLDGLANKAQQTSTMYSVLTNAIKTQSGQLRELSSEYVQAYINYGANSAQAQNLAMKIQEVNSSLKNNRDSIDQAQKSLKQLTAEESKYSNESNKTAKSTKSVGKGFGNLISQFGRLLKLKIMRTIVMQVMQAFNDGIKNLYEYSTALNSVDSSNFKNTMDSYSTAMLKLKNSIAAAVAPLIQQFVPVIQQVVDWLILGINAINQFISALQGKGTWTKATDYFQAYGDTASAATGAVKELQRTILGFDEINALNDDNAGGRGGGVDATPDYSKMFEEAVIGDWFKELAEVFEPLNQKFGELKEKIVSIFRSSEMQEFINELSELVVSILSDILDITIRLFDAIDVSILADILKKLKDIWNSKLVQAVINFEVSQTISAIADTLQLVADALGVVSDLLNGDIDGAIRNAGKLFLSFGKLVQGQVKALGDFIIDVVWSVGNAFISLYNKAIAPFAKAMITAVESVGDLFIKAMYKVEGLFINWVNRQIDNVNNLFGVFGVHLDHLPVDVEDATEQMLNKWHNTTQEWRDNIDNSYKAFDVSMQAIKSGFDDTMDASIERMDEYRDVWDLVCDGQWDKAVELYGRIEAGHGRMMKYIQDHPLKEYIDTGNADASLGAWMRNHSKMEVIATVSALTGSADSALSSFYSKWNNKTLKMQTTLTGTANLNSGKTLTLQAYANGGTPDYGSVFVAGEAGAEMVGTINGRTGVVSQGEISGIRASVDASGMREAQLLSEQNALLRELISKDFVADVNVSSILNGTARANRRTGRPLVAMGS